MADRDLKIPRRKKGAKFHPRESPFPIPVQTITEKESSSDRWFYYNGYFRDNCVVVEDLGDLTFLYKMGFFGKGFLSRSKPEYEVISNISQKAFSKSEKLRRLPPKEREIRQSKFRVIRKGRFKNHQQWSREAASDFMLDADDRADNGQQSVDVGFETPVVVQEEGNTYHPAKRRKEENEADKEDFDTDQLADGYDIAGSSESRLRTEDGDVNMKNNNSGDSEEECITSRDLDEVVQDVVRKNKVTTAQFREQEDLDSPVEDTKQAKQEKISKWQEDPYKVYEHLQLSLEEAFFLSYGLGCLCVWGEEKKPLSLSEMWCAFCAAKQDFIPSYIAYHYFRSKGWVPKVGIKYGTDFVLYKEGMPFYHSSYSVIVQMVESQTLGEENKNDSSPCRKLTWPQLCGVSRVNGHAAKEVMICYVIKPSGLTKDEMSSPSCIPRFKLQEVVLRRWIPERAREPDKAET